jgi:hypothetical protein
MLRFSKTDNAVDSHFHFGHPRVDVTLEDIPIQPTYPESPKYWALFQDTLDHLSAAKTKSKYVSGVAPCLERAGYTRADLCAEAVHNDWPSDLMKLAAKHVTKSSPWRDLGLEGVFTDKLVLLDHLIAIAGWAVSANSLAIKDHFKVPRPEEVAGAIARGEIECPELLKSQLWDFPGWSSVKEDQRTFTMYPEGSPLHGSWNAMHSAAASAQRTVISVMLAMTRDDYMHTLLTMENVGGFRKSAGVHTEEDNLLGYWLGQFITEKWLHYFIEDIGGDSLKVVEALAEVHVDFISQSA